MNEPSMYTHSIPVTQNAAGTTLLVPAPGPGLYVRILSYQLSFATGGTFKFADGLGDVTGEFTIVNNADPLSNPSSPEYFASANENQPLYLVTANTKASGVVTVRVDMGGDLNYRTWLFVNLYDGEAETTLPACVNMNDVSSLHDYVTPNPYDWKYHDLGIRTVLHMNDGSRVYVKEVFDNMRRALGAQAVRDPLEP